MRHSLSSDGLAFRLRPVAEGDSPFIVRLRNDPHAKAYINPSAPDVAAQDQWLDRYFEREGDYYFVLERISDGTSEGLCAIYEVDAARKRAEWGRWVLRPGSPAAVESAWLIYRMAFEVLGLDEIYCRTLAANEHVVSFHDSCGLPRRERLRDFVRIRGIEYDAIEHALSALEWPAVSVRLERLAASVARRCGARA